MEELLKSIRYNERRFPLDELLRIIEQKDEAIPFLLQILADLKEDYKKVIDRPERFDHIYAYYLLAEFKVKALFPLIIDILSMPKEAIDTIFGDAITEDIGRIIATVYNGEIDLLMGLIENAESDEYARGQAVVALVVLVFNGQLTREFVLDYFKQLMNGKLTGENYYLYAEIVCGCNELYPEEVYEDIKRLYDDQVIEEFVIDLSTIEETLKKPKEAVFNRNQKRSNFQLITSTIKELETWQCFEPEQFKASAVPFLRNDRRESNNEPKRNPAVKVENIGRNDPCSCGSGKKYKKCCGK